MKRKIIFLVALVCSFFTELSQAQNPVLYLKYDESTGASTTLDDVNNVVYQIPNNFDAPERIPGVYGNALRTDGFSTWAIGDFNVNINGQFTAQTWLSLESYPSDEELPYNGLTPSAIISQKQGNQGFAIGINTFGVWWFEANVSGQLYRVQAPTNFPLYEWVQVAGVIDALSGKMKLILNGVEIASVDIPTTGELIEANVPLIVGKSNVDKTLGIFLLNGLNAAIDETKLFGYSKPPATLLSEYNNGILSLTSTGFEAIAVPVSRFAADLQRPIYHGMPPANWTNEPHGLVKYNGQYHMFYQRTPNGPYKMQMHWGHMSSSDFVHWTHHKDALWPTLDGGTTFGTDMKGIWSGDVVVENGVAHALYTSVNHGGSFNPGISLATSADANLDNWTKQGPVINKEFVNDFRDPYLWKEGNVWHMIIGAAVGSGGGLDYYTSADLSTWIHQNQFSTVDYAQMDVGSVIWEMPVFESIGNGKHILIVNPTGGSASKYGPTNYTRAVYWTGVWSGGVFSPDYNQPKKLDVIHGHLSPTVTRNDNNQLVGIGMVDERWSSQAQLDAGWCHTYSLPRVYSLLADNQTLGQSPAPELESLRTSGASQSYTSLVVDGVQTISAQGNAIEIVATIDPSTNATAYGINFSMSDNGDEITRLYYDVATHEIVLDKSNSSLSPDNEESQLLRGSYDENAFGKPERFHVFIDHSIIDVFINDAAAFSSRIYPTKTDSKNIQLYANAATNFVSVDVFQLDQAIGGLQTSVTLSDDGEITEKNEDGEQILVSLSNNQFVNPINANNWTMTNLPSGVVLGSVSRVSDTEVMCTLLGNSIVDYDEDINNVALNISSAEFEEETTSSVISSTGITFSAMQEPVTNLTLSYDSDIEEGSEAGEEILVTLTNNKFESQIQGQYWNIDNMPVGLGYSLTRLNDSQVQITINGESEDYDEDILSFSVSVDTAQFVNFDFELHDSQVSISGGVVFRAIRGEIIYDFETGDLSNWSITDGNAFSNGDVTGETDWFAGQFNQEGGYHLWGFNEGGDEQTGEISSGVFELEGDGIVRFLISGGNDIDKLYISLVDATTHTELYKVTGHDSETYRSEIINASEYIGTMCYLKVVDNSIGGWGHLNLDQVIVPVPDGDSMPNPPVFSAAGIELSVSTLSLVVGEALVIDANVLPANASNQNVIWSTSNSNILAIDASGNLTGLNVGAARITATTVEGGFTAEATVTITESPSYLVYDFETGDLSGWTVLGSAFEIGDVSTATDWGWGGPFSQQGNYHLWSFQAGNGDGDTGEIRSDDFILGGDGMITFLIGGGYDQSQLYFALYDANDNELLRASGDNNDSEGYVQKSFDASIYIGSSCYLKLVDNHVGGWGHINLDNVVIPTTNYPVTGVVLSQTGLNLAVNESQTLGVSIQPSIASNKSVVWSSSNTEVAVIDSNGTITAISEGIAQISVTSLDGGFTDYCMIGVSAPQYLIYDFESGDLTGWTIAGDAFVAGDVTSDTDWGWGGSFNPQGNFHLWGVKAGSDAMTGSIQSSNFTLGGNGVITFLVGGGFDANLLFVGLYRVSDDAELMKVTGDNNDSEAYALKSFDAIAYLGERCYIKVVDNHTGGWGHINIDNLVIPINDNSQSVRRSNFLVSSEEQVSENEIGLSIFPNPSDKERINVSWNFETLDDNGSISIIDMNGRVLLKQQVDVDQKGIELNTERFNSGIYIMTFTANDGFWFDRIIVK